MGFLQNLFSDTSEDIQAIENGNPVNGKQQVSNTPVDGNKQQQIVDASFQRLVQMFVTRLLMFHSGKQGEQIIKERLFLNFPTVIDQKSFIASMTSKLQKELPGSELKMTQRGANAWDVVLQTSINVSALVEKHVPQFRSKLDTTSFNIVNGLNPIPQFLHNPNYLAIQAWINVVEQALVDNLKPIGKPFSYLSGKELTIHLAPNDVFPPQAVIAVENHFSAEGLICKIIDNCDVMEGQTITLSFAPEQPDFTLPQLHGHNDDHVLETSYVDVA